MTCRVVWSGGKKTYICQIDCVRVWDANGTFVKDRLPTAVERKRFANFNARYTAAVNRLARNPGKQLSWRQLARTTLARSRLARGMLATR